MNFNKYEFVFSFLCMNTFYTQQIVKSTENARDAEVYKSMVE